MNGTTITHKGNNYTREVELLGDVEKVKWYHEPDFKEIYDQDEMFELENIYEGIILAEITPQVFFI